MSSVSSARRVSAKPSFSCATSGAAPITDPDVPICSSSAQISAIRAAPSVRLLPRRARAASRSASASCAATARSTASTRSGAWRRKRPDQVHDQVRATGAARVPSQVVELARVDHGRGAVGGAGAGSCAAGGGSGSGTPIQYSSTAFTWTGSSGLLR